MSPTNSKWKVAMQVWFALAVGSGSLTCAQSPSEPESYRRINDICYAEIDGHRLLLDLHLPATTGSEQSAPETVPLVVWIHGGAWRSGSKDSMPLVPLVRRGFAIASIDYRLSPVAKFPAQIHDCKAAIRFLRASADEYGYNAERVGVAGASAGGHLAALVGVSNGVATLEGVVGEHRDQSSEVHAIVDFYGPTNFLTILGQSTPHGLSVRVPALNLLLGDRPERQPELARSASPVFHVDRDDPALLMIHGDQDPQVPINQSHELHGKYKSLHLKDVQFEVVHGGAHGGPEFFDKRRLQLVESLFSKHLRGRSKQPSPKSP